MNCKGIGRDAENVLSLVVCMLTSLPWFETALEKNAPAKDCKQFSVCFLLPHHLVK